MKGTLSISFLMISFANSLIINCQFDNHSINGLTCYGTLSGNLSDHHIEPFTGNETKDVKYFSAKNDDIERFPVGLEKVLPSLETLSVSFPKLKEFDCENSFSGSLKNVFISESSIEFITKELFQSLKNLKELKIKSHNIKSIEQDSFSSLSKLERLDVDFNCYKDQAYNPSQVHDLIGKIRENCFKPEEKDENKTCVKFEDFDGTPQPEIDTTTEEISETTTEKLLETTSEIMEVETTTNENPEKQKRIQEGNNQNFLIVLLLLNILQTFVIIYLKRNSLVKAFKNLRTRCNQNCQHQNDESCKLVDLKVEDEWPQVASHKSVDDLRIIFDKFLKDNQQSGEYFEENLKYFIFKKDKDGRNALMLTILNRNFENFRYVLDEVYLKCATVEEIVNEVDDGGWNVFHFIAAHGDLKTVEHFTKSVKFERNFIEKPNKKLQNFLHLLAGNENIESVKVIFDSLSKDLCFNEMKDILQASDSDGKLLLHHKIISNEIIDKFYEKYFTQDEIVNMKNCALI